MITQMRIVDAHNTGQYWPNLDNQQSAIVIGHRLHRSSAGQTTAAFVDGLNLPIFSRNLAHCRPYTKPIITFTMASSFESRRARVRPRDPLLGHVSLLPRQSILEVKKPEFCRTLASFCAENKRWQPELAAKCIPELSFQQRHDIGHRSSAIFFRYWAVEF